MGTRIGFMESKKAGRCFYCKDEIAVSTADQKVICGYDNNIKRRICQKCGMSICDKGGDVVIESPPATKEKPKLFTGKDDLLEKINQAIERIEQRLQKVEQAIGADE